MLIRFARITALAVSLFASCCFAASGQIDLIGVVKVLHSKTPASTKWRRITGVIAQVGNALDWYQTVRYAGPGGGGCEENPLLVTAPCVLNVPKFQALKAAIAIGIAAEETPHIFHWPHAEEWDKVGLMGNIVLDGLFTALTIHNAISIQQISSAK